MQEVLERTDGQVRLWPAALYGLLRELQKLEWIVESDKRPSADEDDERRRYFALTPLGKRVLDGEVRRLEAIVHMRARAVRCESLSAHDRRRVLRWWARSYAQLLRVLRVRDSGERHAIREDGERLLTRRTARGASRWRRPGWRWSGMSSSAACGTTSHRRCGRWCALRESPSAAHSSSDWASPPRPRSSPSSTRCCSAAPLRSAGSAGHAVGVECRS